ncbi:MAG: cardiolipin synthase [Coriobacteriia bacterium]|nr:cardiolipin synthase [Coriobacteriia bacterium]
MDLGWLASLITWRSLYVVALGIYWISVAITVITDDREPTHTLAWLLVLIAFPLVGLVFYYFFGRNWRKRLAKDPWTAEVAMLAHPVMQRVRMQYAEYHKRAVDWTIERGYEDIPRIIENTQGATVLPAHEVEILVNGGAKFPALLHDLSEARETIDMQYFIWKHDELSASVAKVLHERLREGVEVRILNDWIGNIFYSRDELDALRAAGARVEKDLTRLRQINYRSHRKIVVIDGTIGYTGGINIAQEYIDGGSRFPSWRDTHVRFTGPAVADLQGLFATRWHRKTGESLFNDRFFPTVYPEHGHPIPAQTVADGIDVPWQPAQRAHIVSFAAARERIWIQSPYLVPTPDLYSALIDAALAGVDVRFMMTGLPDKKIAYWAAETFFDQMIDAGIKVYRYTSGFMHAKTMTIDGQIAVIGTMNLDVRSLALHQELMCWFYDPALAKEHEAIFLTDMTACELVTRETVDSWSAWRHLRNATARLASNLL